MSATVSHEIAVLVVAPTSKTPKSRATTSRVLRLVGPLSRVYLLHTPSSTYQACQPVNVPHLDTLLRLCAAALAPFGPSPESLTSNPATSLLDSALDPRTTRPLPCVHFRFRRTFLRVSLSRSILLYF